MSVTSQSSLNDSVSRPRSVTSTEPSPLSAAPLSAAPLPQGLRAKALVEWLCALVLAIVLLPLMGVLALAVKLSSRGPAIHRRRVLGRGGVQFDAFKFRTMVEDADDILERDPVLKQAYSKQFKLEADPRVTRVGRLLRRVSLDELPQLFNVLRGEMALIGPRMISAPELEKYGSSAERLLMVRPGLTGLWQTSGRQTTTYEERVTLDMSYITHWSPWLDLRIALRTVRVVVTGDGAL